MAVAATPPKGDSFALRLFVLMWLALVLSHAGAWLVVHALTPPPAWPLNGVDPGTSPAPPRPPPGGTPPMPTLPSLPPTRDLLPTPGPGGAPAPALPPGAVLLDYGVRLTLIALFAWWGSRWLARPMRRLVAASEALVPALRGGQRPAPLDDTRGTREVRAAAGVFNRMAAQIQQLFEGRGLMIAAISHDLRTPLTRMRMRVETAELDATVRARCVADLHEMNALIDAVLEVFRGQGAGAALAPQRTDIGALLQAVVDDRAEAGGHVVFNAPATKAGAAQADTDPLALRRVVGNLVDNALRHAGDAGPVHVTLRAEPLALTIGIEDQGPGIPPERLAEVLQPFVRLEGSRNAAGGGTGLGLFIANELVQRLGGRLSLANRAGGGLRAEVRLPTRSP